MTTAVKVPEAEIAAYNCGPATVTEMQALHDRLIAAGKRGLSVEPKYDGFRLICVVDDGHVRMYTRAMKRQDLDGGKLPHIAKELLATFPPGTVLDGEIMALSSNADGTINNNFERVQSVMLSQPKLAREKQGVDLAGDRVSGPFVTGAPLQFVMFDLTHNGGHDLRMAPLYKRRELMVDYLEDQASKSDVASIAYISATPVFDWDTEAFERFCAMGFEGVVVKEEESVYQSGRRGKGWYKLKLQTDIDVVIVGYEPGRGKFTGQVGAVIFGQPCNQAPGDTLVNPNDIIDLGPAHNSAYLVRGQCSGMDDKERQYITDNQQALLGTVMTVAHMGMIAHSGGRSPKLRHPQFKRLRPDRLATDVEWHDK